MVAILSSGSFNPNDSLWSISGPDSDKSFITSNDNKEIKAFENRPLASSVKDVVTDVDENIIDETTLEILEPLEEGLDEVVEETLSLTETQLNQQLVEARQEVESEVSARLENSFQEELQALKTQQGEFFRLLAKNLNDGDQLLSQFTAMAIKVGTLLARTELCLDHRVIEEFISKSIKATGEPEGEIFSIRFAESWRPFASKLENLVPNGITLVFDETLQPGDLILAAGQGGYFDLLEERLNDIEGQLHAIDKSNLADEKIDIFQHIVDPTFEKDDSVSAKTAQPAEENSLSPESQVDSVVDDAFPENEPQVPLQTERMTLEGEEVSTETSEMSRDSAVEANEPPAAEDPENSEEGN